jgi:hypothetical protein
MVKKKKKKAVELAFVFHLDSQGHFSASLS